MKAPQSLVLAALLVGGLQVTGAAAMPALHLDADTPADGHASVESIRIYCGRFHCYRTYGYGYGYRHHGYGYRPYRYGYGFPRLGFGLY